MGPFTDVNNRIAHGHQPVDHDDFVSMQHDLDYEAANNMADIYLADIKAIAAYKNDFHGLLGKTGLILKDLIVPPIAQMPLFGPS